MSEPLAVFFYGSYMNRAVLREVELEPEHWEPAALDGWDIRIAPRANLVRAPARSVHGVLSRATQPELDHLYAHARDVLGETYLPENVEVRTRDGALHAALCYVAPSMREAPPDPAYVERILQPARELGLPPAYLARLEAFRPEVARALLVRHCESSGQAPDAPLTPRGRAQAEALAAELSKHPIDSIVSSPYLRARETIAPFAARAGLALRVHEGLAERRLSPQPIDDWREVVQRAFVDLEHRVAGGESGRETLDRGWAALDRVLRAGDRLPVVVSHGQLLSLVLHSIDDSFGFEGWQALTNPDVFLLERGAGRLAFERVRL